MFDFSAFFAQYGNLFLQGTVDTLIMTCVATILAYYVIRMHLASFWW